MVHKNQKSMEIIDKSNMRQKILDFPKQFRIGLKAAENVKIIGNFKRVLLCGVGGSALPGEILNMFFWNYKIDLPLHVHRDYGLPYYAAHNKNFLVICNSYSGNTEETLFSYNEAIKNKLQVIAITSGGKLLEISKKNKTPVAIIPQGYPPRMALGYQFAAFVKILANCRLIKSKKSLKDILALENNLKPANIETEGKNLAKKLVDKIPLIYASRRLKIAAKIWKIKFNENSKTPAFYNYFPELNHNEHGQFDGNKNDQFYVIILRDDNDYIRIRQRMDLLAQILKAKKIPALIIDMKGKNALNKLFSVFLLGDWASYYLALEYGMDPTPVKLNDKFKRRLASSPRW